TSRARRGPPLAEWAMGDGTGGPGPDQRGEEPEMPPVQRVDEHAVREQPAPRRGRRGGADAVGVSTEDRVATREGQGQEQELEQDEHAEHALLRERADGGAVRGVR